MFSHRIQTDCRNCLGIAKIFLLLHPASEEGKQGERLEEKDFERGVKRRNLSGFIFRGAEKASKNKK